MSRLLCVLLLLGSASAAFGQVIFAPPDVPQPCFSASPSVLELQYALRQPRGFVPCSLLPPPPVLMPFVEPYSSVLIVPSGPFITPEAAGIDPQTAQPLHFRKRELLMPPVGLPVQPPQTQPLIVPQLDGQPKDSGPEPGQIIIKPWKGGAKSFASR